MGNYASRLYSPTTVTPRNRLIDSLNGIVLELQDIDAKDEEAQKKCVLSKLLQLNYIEFRFLDEGYANWCKVCLCFQVLKECLEPFTREKADEVYKTLKANVQAKQIICTCSDSGKQIRDKQSSKKDLNKCCAECKEWVSKIEIQAPKVQVLVWDNIILSEAKSDPWALVKVYLPVGCKYHSGPADADSAALLTFIERCNVFIGHINIDTVKEVREIRNTVFHSSTLKLDTDELSKYKGTITDLLRDKDALLLNRRQYITDIEKICGHKTVIGKKEENRNFKAIARVLKEKQRALTERLEQGTSDDNFETTVNDIKQIQQESKKVLSFVEFNAIADIELKSALETTVDKNEGASKKLIYQQIQQESNKILSCVEFNAIADIELKLTGIAKPEPLKVLPFEPPNNTDVEESMKQIQANDTKLKHLNLNNIKNISLDRLEAICEGLKTNTELETLEMASVAMTDRVAKKLAAALQENKTLKNLNVESNFISGNLLVEILKAVNKNQTVIELRVANQKPEALGNKVETQITKLIEANETMLRFGIALKFPEARSRVTEKLQTNNDQKRKKRLSDKGES